MEDQKEKDSEIDQGIRVDEKEQEGDEGPIPSFTIKDVNSVGEVLISFTEIMRGVDDLSLINDQILLIDIVPDWTNTSDDPNAFEFSWSVTEFEAKYMKIQIVWDNFYQVSSG